jgi:hypothetical protein
MSSVHLSGSAPFFMATVEAGSHVLGRIAFDVRDYPPLHLAVNAADPAARSTATQERQNGGTPMIWLDNMLVEEQRRLAGVGSAILDFIVDQFPNRTLTNSTSLSEAGEAFLRAWLVTRGVKDQRFLWRVDDRTIVP